MSQATFAARVTLLVAVLVGMCLAAATHAAPSIRTMAGVTTIRAVRPRVRHLPHTAASTPTASLSAKFEPERLGQRTTLRFGFRISTAGGLLPPALSAIDLSYPNNLGIALSGLGLATCTTARLETAGVMGCQANSIMGLGNATAEISLGSDVVSEPVPITILRAPDEAGHISLLFDVVGSTPLNTSAVLAGALLPASPPFGGQVSIEVPLIASLPGAPDVSIVRLAATLGPSGVIYYEQRGSERFAYQPPGILLPISCPRGGFPFAAQFSFVDGSHASARTTDPCRARAASRGRKHS